LYFVRDTVHQGEIRVLENENAKRTGFPPPQSFLGTIISGAAATSGFFINAKNKRAKGKYGL